MDTTFVRAVRGAQQCLKAECSTTAPEHLEILQDTVTLNVKHSVS